MDDLLKQRIERAQKMKEHAKKQASALFDKTKEAASDEPNESRPIATYRWHPLKT